MRHRNRTGLLLIGCLTATAHFPLHAQHRSELLIDEGQLRRMIIHQQLPEYPDDSQSRAARSVVVAKVHINEDGKPLAVDVLQSPSAPISISVQRSVMSWTFAKASDYGIRGPFSGKLTFYFVPSHSKAVVYNPSDAPYIGP
jgi:hypothetical protein